MQLQNPVQFQKFHYRKLNEHRIRGLLSKRVSDHRQKFYVNQFVTLRDPNTIKGANSSKLNIPGCKNLYKIVEIAKNGFQLRLLNIETRAEKTVTHNLVNSINLEDLEQIHFGRPELYSQLVALMRKKRHTYVAGSRSTGGLHQVMPFDQLGKDQPELPHHEDNLEDGDDEHSQDQELEDEHSHVVERLRPDFDNPEQDGEEQPVVEQQELPEKRRITRYQGQRHVYE